MPVYLSCPERARISERVDKAVRGVLRARAEHRVVKEKCTERDRLWAALVAGRMEQHVAEAELHTHTANHGCGPGWHSHNSQSMPAWV
jgi:hypothetical protein